MNAMHRDLIRLASRIEAEDAPRAAQDPARQHWHLQPPTGWLNDPNGLCVYKGQYHAFYQYAPFAADGSGAKFWGHAVSTDLVHWQPLPVMLCPDQPYDIHGVYSGSALVEGEEMYLYYTGNVKYSGDYDYITAGRGHNVCLAVSRDGVTMAEKTCLLYNADYPAGLTCHVRDPKVFAHEGRYYMVLGARTLDDVGEVLVWESTDRRSWTHINTLKTPASFGYMWECPDLFEVDGQWFLAVSPQGLAQQGDCFQNIYASGYFPVEGDWRTGGTLGKFVEFDKGFDYYAPQSFFDPLKGRRVQIGWMGMPDAEYTNPLTYGWQHCLTAPCVLTVWDGRLLRTPAPELEAIRADAEATAAGEHSLPLCFDWELTCTEGFCLELRGSLRLTFAEGTFTMELTDSAAGFGRSVRRAEVEALHSVRVLGDASSVEVFLNGGETVLTTRYYPAPDCRTARMQGAQGTLYALRV